jgi:hypothetical protein
MSRADDRPPTVGVHLHFGMTGTLPLRLAELFFTDEGLTVVEYGTITPLFGLATGGHRREAARMADAYVEDGIEGAERAGDRTVHLEYDEIDRIVCFDGRMFAREKVAIHLRDDEPPYAYRIHAPVDLEEFAAGLATFPPTVDVEVAVRSGIGFRPSESIARFRTGR